MIEQLPLKSMERQMFIRTKVWYHYKELDSYV